MTTSNAKIRWPLKVFVFLFLLAWAVSSQDISPTMASDSYAYPFDDIRLDMLKIANLYAYHPWTAAAAPTVYI